MINPLYLPELREMLAENNAQELKEFCEAIHPARTADFMEGLSPQEVWQVLEHTDLTHRAEIFQFLDIETQVQIIEGQDRAQMATLIAAIAPDDRVDILHNVNEKVVDELLALIPSDDRRDILHLRSYPEGTAGAIMTTEVATLSEEMTVRQAVDHLQKITEQFETIYYLFIVDESNHLRGLVSARKLLSNIGRPNTKMGELMETALVTAEVDDDQQEVAQKVARYDLLAIPVVDAERKMRGIITHDDVIDVMQEEATADAHRAAAVAPLTLGYLETRVLTLVWKRGLWLVVLFIAALMTAFVLRKFEPQLAHWKWLVAFIPLIISCGGNSGNQSATLVITGLRTNDIELADWTRLARREILLGIMLGLFLGACGLITVAVVNPQSGHAMWVVPLTIMGVVMAGSLVGCLLPVIFQRIGLDPALMSNPFVACISDILGILIYMAVASLLLRGT